MDFISNKMKKLAVPLLISAALLSCHKDAPAPALTSFSDDFERYASAVEMVGTADDQWTEFNVNMINTASDTISLDTTIVHSGKKSVRFHCSQSDPGMTDVCKCNLNKGGMDFRQGETMYFSAWFYLQRADMHYGTFFVFDMEEIVHGSTGLRIMAWEENLEVERGKMGLSNIYQKDPVTLFPVNQWTHLELEIKLSQYNHGSAKMWIDGNKIIDQDKIRTMPKDIANMVWDTKGFYDRIQVGITAKNGTQDLTLYLDDVEFRKK